MSSDRVYIITKADDLGSNDSANRAFIHAYENGILRNGVIMMTCDKAADAAKYFKTRKDFCMGLHLTMNAEWDNVRWGPVLPTTSVPSIVDENGHLHKTTAMLKEGKPKINELIDEINAQYEAAIDLGLDIRYLDMHMWFHVIDNLLAKEISEFVKQKGLIDVNHFTRTPHIPYEPNYDRVEMIIEMLKGLSPGVYFWHMGHPAFNTEEMQNLGINGMSTKDVALERESDLSIITDERIKRFMSSNRIIPVTVEEASLI